MKIALKLICFVALFAVASCGTVKCEVGEMATNTTVANMAPAITSVHGVPSDLSISISGVNLASVNKLQYTDMASSQSGELSGSRLKFASALQVLFYQDLYMANSANLYKIKVFDSQGNESNEMLLDLRSQFAQAITVSAASQPVSSLAIQGASRVPFTKITLTAGSSDVVVNGITVERQGAAVDANFSGIILLKEDGTQLDTAKTLDPTTHQTIIGGTFTVKAGSSINLTVAGNMASNLTAYAGQVAILDVVAVNTTGMVIGLFPIAGAMHTINASLAIGTVVGTTSGYDPGATAFKAIGSNGYRLTAVRLTAGFAENVRMDRIRFYQVGSALPSDLANVKIFVDDAAYETTVSADGKYYTGTFNTGIVIAKGLSKDIWISADIVGPDSAGRTIDFDLRENSDIYLTGETYGQGIVFTGTVNNTDSIATPAIDGYFVTIFKVG